MVYEGHMDRDGGGVLSIDKALGRMESDKGTRVGDGGWQCLMWSARWAMRGEATTARRRVRRYKVQGTRAGVYCAPHKHGIPR